MMNRKMNLRILVSVFIALLFQQAAAISPESDELKIERERTFTGAGLYGFMNGGADQFMEYGVLSLSTRDIIYKGENYTVDIYEMPTVEDAYGIYSIHVFRCLRTDTLDCIDCLSPYQLQAVSGNSYVSIVFPSGSEDAQKGADELLRSYVPKEENETKDVVPEIIVPGPPFSGVVKYLKGPLSVSTASRALTGLLKGRVYKGVWFTEDKDAGTFQALICMPDKEQLESLKKELPADSVLQTGEGYIYMKGKELEDDTQDYGPFGF